jgi:anti-sigma factor RsiW
MSSLGPHPGDRLQEWLDGRLAPGASAEVEAHLSACVSCREERDRLVTVRETLRAALPARDLPRDFEAELERLLDHDDGGAAELALTPAVAPPATEGTIERRLPGRLLTWGAVAAALVLFAVYLSWQREPVTVVTGAHDVFERQRSPDAPLDLVTAEASELERYFNANLSFRVKVYDLAMMGYRLVGGRIEQVAGRETSIAVYEDSAGRRVLCEMFVGSVGDLPPPSERREHNGITFAVYHRDGQTLVFWPEGKLICVLVSDGPSEDVIQLAFAKAIKV